MSQTQSLNAIALISGGKDSFYSILHCLANGHQIVALANLYPPPPPPSSSTTESDLNSYMYQTVGHALIPLYATALNLPLYRQEILGSALNSQKDYYPPFLSESPRANLCSPTGTNVDNLEDQEVEELIEQLQHVWSNDSFTACGKLSHIKHIWQYHPNKAPVSRVSTSYSATTTTNYDETESLVPLLRHVVAAHPSANAVCAGAILSTYQRTRIESVAQRLHLVPLSYLWQYPSLPTPIPRRAGLLEDMRTVGLDARIVKVASGGLDKGLLWENVLDPEVKGKVEKAVGRFGGSVLGEGGEFETLVLDGPVGVWKKSIQVREDERWVGTGQGGEAWVGLREGAGMVVEKGQGDGWKERLRGVDMWDKQFRDLLASMPNEGTAAESKELKEINPYGSVDQAKTLTQQPHDWHIECSQTMSNSTLRIFNLTAAYAGDSAEHQMVIINAELRKILRNHDRHPSDIVFTTLLLRSMTDFSIVNSIYANLFAEPNPPTRVTVACGDSMPKGVEVLASFVVDLGLRQVRDGLHVQSRSYWAPANIGPYSQAIAVPFELEKNLSLVYVAGQIPLVPASMEVLREENDVERSAGDDFPLLQKQTCLSLQHLWRIGKTMQVRWWTGAIAFITGDRDVRRKAMLAWLTWKRIHDVNEWQEDQEVSEDGLDDAWDKKYGGMGNHAAEEEEHRLPDFQMVNWDRGEDPQHIHIPGFFAIQVAGLPRGCSIEWQSIGLVSLDHLFQASLELSTKDGNLTHTCNIGSKRISIISIPLTTLDLRTALEKVVDPTGISKQTENALHATIYTRKAWLVADLKAQVVPCEGVWGTEGKELAAAAVVVYEEYDHPLTRTSP